MRGYLHYLPFIRQNSPPFISMSHTERHDRNVVILKWFLGQSHVSESSVSGDTSNLFADRMIKLGPGQQKWSFILCISRLHCFVCMAPSRAMSDSLIVCSRLSEVEVASTRGQSTWWRLCIAKEGWGVSSKGQQQLRLEVGVCLISFMLLNIQWICHQWTKVWGSETRTLRVSYYTSDPKVIDNEVIELYVKFCVF